MSIIERNLTVNMIRDDLENIPLDDLSAGVSLRWYRPGDEQHWVDIHVEADPYNEITREVYVQEFGADASNSQVLGRRQAYLVDDGTGKVFGTATAWWDDNYHGLPYGRIHWVAIVPSMQGKGLARPLLSIVCRRMKELGDVRAYLVTSTGRIPAINLYARFGFRPDIRSEDDLIVWRDVQEHVKVPLVLQVR
ncbi:MAG: GNAT family N-acetyltransferase [Anaerolineae bacterium]|nr:GNAT family N-acetyltransferase [Anaerolineae bacterium]